MTTPTTPPEPNNGAYSAALAAAYSAAVARVRRTTFSFVERAWNLSGSWRDADADRFVRVVTPVVEAAERSISTLTTSYLNRTASEVTGHQTPTVTVPSSEVTGSALRGGVDPEVVYRRPYRQVWTDLAAGTPLEKAVEAGERRAVNLAATDLQLAKTHTAQNVGQRDGRIVGWRRVPQGSYTCALCLITSTVRYRKQDMVAIHPACVVEGTRVSASGVQALTRRWYAGELVVITAASGDQVTVTPNHPVLTDQGWVPAYLVREGDHVVRSSSGHRAVYGRPHERQSPAFVEDVWRAAAVPGLVGVPLAPQDFHGDGADGEVQVVRPDRHLPPVGDVTFVQPLDEPSLVGGLGFGIALPRQRGSAAFIPAGLAPSTGGVGSGGLTGALLGGHLCSAHQASLAATANVGTLLHERAADRLTGHPVLLSEHEFGLSTVVLPGDGIQGKFAPYASARRFDPPPVEFAQDRTGGYADAGRRLLGALAGQVSLDRVVELRRVHGANHVYNLQTAEGWYAANGLVVSNCDCTIEAIYGHFDPGPVLDEKLLEAVHDAIARDLGEAYVARSGRREDTAKRLFNYRDIVIVHEHGEIGPVLGVRGHKFTGPEDIPKGVRKLTHDKIRL